MKKAYVFPGQGAQAPGMGQDLFEAHRAMFEQADAVLGFGLTDLMFHGSMEDLTQTKVTQPAGVEMVMPGDNVKMEVELIAPIAMDQGLRFAIREGGRTVGAGVVAKVIA